MLNAIVMSAFGGIIVGRAGYVLLNLDYFQEHLNEIVSTASPGLWGHTVIVGALAGWLIARQMRQAPPSPIYLVFATLTGIGASAGCIPVGCAYGREVFWTDGWLWQLRVDWPDAYLIDNPRLPTQLFMIAWLALCLIVMCVAYARHLRVAQKGWALALWVMLFAIGDFAIQFARADAMPTLGPLRAAQWADVLFIALGSVAIVWQPPGGPTRPAIP